MLSTFVATVAGRGLATKNRYRISVAPPSSLGKMDNSIALMCESIEFPGQNFSSQPDLLRYGPSREMATGVTYAPITATFICSPDMYEKRFFENWQLLVMDMYTWEPRFYKDYIGGLKVYQLDRANNATYVVELFEVYPKTITAQDLGYATNDAYHTIAVEFIYHHWEWMDEATTPRRFASSGSIDDLSKVQVDDFGGMAQANAARKDRDAAANVDDFSSMPDADQSTTPGPKGRRRRPLRAKSRGTDRHPASMHHNVHNARGE